MKVIFMGTHQFAVKVLEKILERHEVVLVVTQPDSLVGRKKILTPSAVKECALKHGLEVFQPVKLNDEREKILLELLSVPVQFDRIGEQAELDISPAELAAVLTMLEIKGAVKQLPGKYYQRTVKKL